MASFLDALLPDLESASDGSSMDSPLDLLLRLTLALLLGGVVAWIYRRTRRSTDVVSSFPATLVFLSVLIAMVTQVIGDNIARAFSLVGALSIVRFRTVVRDTQDTAYVIFAVVVGMAVGAQNLWVAFIGILVTGVAAFVMMLRAGARSDAQPAYTLSLRLAIGHDVETLAGSTLDQYLEDRQTVSIATARQGVSLDVIYETRLRAGVTGNELVKALNRIEGIQNVELQRRGFEEP